MKRSARLHTTGTIELPIVHPQGQTEIKLPLAIPQRLNGELWLTLCFQLRTARSWADVGHTINTCQTQLTSANQYLLAQPHTGALSVIENNRSIEVSSSEFTVKFDRNRGSVGQLTYRGQQVFKSSATHGDVWTFGFWRAPTDNDQAWQAAEWREYGLDAMTVSVLSCQLVSHDSEEATVECAANIMPPILAWGFKAVYTFTITSQCAISVKSKLTPFGPAPTTLPRVGLELQLSSTFSSAEWFGLGPGESYSDKKLSQLIGIHSSSLLGLQTRYDVPQENGNHTQTRWLKVTDAAGSGLRVDYKAGAKERSRHFQWALLEYDADVLEKARHPADLVPRKSGPLLRLDCDHAGLGTAACGPGPNKDCQVACREVEFEFIIRPL